MTNPKGVVIVPGPYSVKETIDRIEAFLKQHGATQSTPEVPTTAADGAGIGDNLITINTSALMATFGRIIFQWEQRPPMFRKCKR